MPTATPTVARLCLAAYLLVPALLVLGPLPADLLDEVTRQVQALVTDLGSQVAIGRNDVEKVSNVLMFIPIGFLLVPAFPQTRLSMVVLACATASLGIELLQTVVLPGRYASLLDVALNTIGAAGGVALAWSLLADGSRS